MTLINKRAVSPVIATVLIIALTVSAAALVWTLVINKTEVTPEIAVNGSIFFSDSSTDPDLLVDQAVLQIRNLGPGSATVNSVTVEQDNKYTWTIIDPLTSFASTSEISVTIRSSETGEQLLEGDVTIELKYTGKKLLILNGIVPGGDSVDQIITLTQAIAYQDECTCTSADAVSLISDLDGTTAPAVPDGTVNKPYFATGGSNQYYDALALNYDITGGDPLTHTATLRIFIFDGGYSSTWHHYIILKNQVNTTYQDVSPPGASIAWDDALDNGPNALQIDILLKSSDWTSGSFWITLRLWDAKVDMVQLILTPNA